MEKLIFLPTNIGLSSGDENLCSDLPVPVLERKWKIFITCCSPVSNVKIYSVPAVPTSGSNIQDHNLIFVPLFS